jgi:hypothetical protein
MLAAGLVIVAAALVGARALTSTGGGTEVAHEQTAAATASAATNNPSSPTTVSAPAEGRVVEIRALTQAWLEARGPDGTVFLSRTLEPGDVYRPDASPGWTLHARDGAAFQLYVNGADAGLLGTAGMPVLGRQIDGIQPITQAQLTPPRS